MLFRSQAKTKNDKLCPKPEVNGSTIDMYSHCILMQCSPGLLGWLLIDTGYKLYWTVCTLIQCCQRPLGQLLIDSVQTVHSLYSDAIQPWLTGLAVDGHRLQTVLISVYSDTVFPGLNGSAVNRHRVQKLQHCTLSVLWYTAVTVHWISCK